MSAKPDLWRFFDACAVVGRGIHRPADWPTSAGELLADMDHHGVAEALVVDCLARENHPADGNARILEICRNEPRLHPGWAALPTGPEDEQPPPGAFLEALRRYRVGAVYLYPRQYRFELSDWCVDHLLEPLASAGVPIFVNYDAHDDPGRFGWDRTDLNAVVSLCRRWPELPVIVSESRIRRSNRMLYRALDVCPNLRIELSGYWLYRGIEFITRRCGAERLLFGSNWPTMGYHTTVAGLTMAEIETDDKEMIAGGNLRRLVRWCAAIEHPEVCFPPPDDEFAEWGRTGRRPSGQRLLDCHGHLGRASHYHIPDGELADVVRELDRMGVEKAIVFPFSGIFGGDEAFGNECVASAVRRFPDRFLGLTLVNPNRGRQEMMRELERGQEMDLRGVKLIHVYQGVPDEHPLVDLACQWAHEHRQIILNHNWGSPAQLERLVSTYPNACYLAGHTTTAFSGLMERYDNIYVCTVPLHGPRDCEQVVARIGADRLVFGSDLLDLPVSWGLGPILFARISPAEKRSILRDNLKRILEQYSPG